MREAPHQTADVRCLFVTAGEHGSGLVPGQVEVASKPNEVPTLREFAVEWHLAGRAGTLDALRSELESARQLVEDPRAYYVVTAIKNQPAMLDDPQHLLFAHCPCHEMLDNLHGRIEHGRYWAKELSELGWDGRTDLYGRRQGIRIERERQEVKTGKTSQEVSYALTSLSAQQATPGQLAALTCNHCHIGNGPHHMRDSTFDEDRCRVWVGASPRTLATLTSAAIALIRCQGQFRCVPQANRHLVDRPQEALDLLLGPPWR